MPYLKCLGRKEAEYVLKEVHEGICDNHLGASTIAHKLIQVGYYWPIMKIYYYVGPKVWKMLEIFFRNKCVEYRDEKHFLAIAISIMENRFIAAFPLTIGKKKFIIVVVDCFTKWVKVEPFTIIIDQKIIDFV